MNRFINFISEVHPDPDYLLLKTVESALPEIERLADHYLKAIGKTHCKICGKKIESKSKQGMCIPCFTSNA